MFYYERNGYVLSEKKLDNAYRFIRPVFDAMKQRYNICWADFVLLLTQENLALRSENSQLKIQMEAKDNMLTNKDGEILRLLNQIASDMVKRSDVDEMIAAAVKEAVDKVNAENERKMKAMAAEYEAVIASLKKKGKGGKKAER